MLHMEIVNIYLFPKLTKIAIWWTTNLLNCHLADYTQTQTQPELFRMYRARWFLFQVWFLVRDYLEFETVTTYEEIPTVLIPPDSNVELPTMTFCNLDPIRGEPPTDLNIPTMDDYLLKGEEVMRCSNCTEDQKFVAIWVRMTLSAK